METKKLQISLNDIYKPNVKESFYKQVKPLGQLQNLNEKITEVKSIFPYLEENVIKDALQKTNQCTDKAIDLIFNNEITNNQVNNFDDYNSKHTTEILYSNNNELSDYLLKEIKKCTSVKQVEELLILNLIEDELNNKKKNTVLDNKGKALTELRKSCSKLFKSYLNNKHILKTNSEQKERLKKLNNDNAVLRNEKKQLELLVNKLS